jgi:hypothetical protein
MYKGLRLWFLFLFLRHIFFCKIKDNSGPLKNLASDLLKDHVSRNMLFIFQYF